MLVQAPTDAWNRACGAGVREMEGAFRTVNASKEWDGKLLDLAAPERRPLIEQLRNGAVGQLSAPPKDRLDASDDTAAPALAVPVTTFGDRLHAVAAYGAHRNGAALDPLDLRLRVQFIGRAAVGYERVEVRRLRAQRT